MKLQWRTVVATLSALLACALANAAPPAAALPPTIADLVLLLKSYQPDLDRIRKLQADLAKPISAEGDPLDLAREWHLKAQVADELSQTDVRMEALTKALFYAEKTAGSGSLNEIGSRMRILQEMLNAIHATKGLSAGIDATEKFVAEFQAQAAGAVVGPVTGLANSYLQLGNIDRAKERLSEAESIVGRIKNTPRAFLFSAGWQANIERARGNIAMAQGKADDAELAYQAAIRMAETNVANTEKVRATGRFAMTELRARMQVDIARRDLAHAYLAQQRLDESELLLREVLKSSLKRDGRNSRLVAITLASLSRLLLERGRYAEGMVVIEWAERTLNEAGFPKRSVESMNIRRLRATQLAAVGRHAEAAALFDELKTLAAEEANNGDTLSAATLIAVPTYIAVNRMTDALSAGDRLLNDNTRSYGPDHYYTAEARAYRAMALQRNGRHDEARKEFERAVAIVIDPTKVVGKQQTSTARTNRLRTILNGYLNVLVGRAGDRREGDTEEAFRVADVARWQSVQKAVAGSALRAAAGTPELAAKIRKVQDNDDELQAVYKNLISQRSAPPDKQLPGVIAAMEKRIAALQAEQTTTVADIRRQFPQYDALTNPRPADAATARKALLPNEALVSIYVTPAGIYVWALGSGKQPVQFHFTPKNGVWLAQQVKRLRDNVDFGQEPDPERMRFDLDAASALYQELLAPVEAAWAQADTLLVVANEALAQIPLSLLPTQAVKVGKPDANVALSQYRQVPWLGRKLAVAYLPSVSALVTLRSIPPSTERRDPFIGFGDPDFGGETAPPSKLATSRGTRNLQITHAAKWDDNQQSADVVPSPVAVTTGTPTLIPLPDTRDEIIAIATAMQADPKKDTHFGRDASPQTVSRADLKHRRVVAFATHGLIAGDLPGLDQPALALAPQPGQNISEGLLKLEDILKLSLDADLVVLSACNTAAADGSGSEAVSGLGRAFFYAGSRSVLATHWPVETVSARQLVSELFQRYAKDSKLTRAKALQQAMLELIDRGAERDARGRPLYSYAHPAFWAPYALYGDPGR